MTTIKTVVEHYEDLIQHYKNVIELQNEQLKRINWPTILNGDTNVFKDSNWEIVKIKEWVSKVY